MKINSYLIAFALLSFTTQSSIYNIQFKKLNGGNVSMAEFTNKKIIVIPFNATNPDALKLHYLDSLQTADTLLQIIGVPATDFSGEGNNGSLNNLYNSLSAKFIMTKQSQVKKETTIYQHVLFKWLTHVSENSHFNEDVDASDKLFIISKAGTLYGILPKETPNSILIQVLNQSIN